MAIGTSAGEYFEDEAQQSLAQASKPSENVPAGAGTLPSPVMDTMDLMNKIQKERLSVPTTDKTSGGEQYDIRTPPQLPKAGSPPIQPILPSNPQQPWGRPGQKLSDWENLPAAGQQFAEMDTRGKNIIDFPAGRVRGESAGGSVPKSGEVVQSPESFTPAQRQLYNTFKEVGTDKLSQETKDVIRKGYDPKDINAAYNRVVAEEAKDATKNAMERINKRQSAGLYPDEEDLRIWYKDNPKLLEQALRDRPYLTKEGQIHDPYMDAVMEQSWNKMAAKANLPEFKNLGGNVLKIIREAKEGGRPGDLLGDLGQKLNEIVKLKLGDKAFEALKKSNPVDITPLK